MMEIITGYTGTRHITPGMDAAVWRSIYGADMYIVNVGNLCAGSMPSINEFSILDGVVDMQGHMGYGTQETLSIDTCATGYKRIDLICCRYEHDNVSLIDSMEYIVIKGTEVQAPNDPVVPSYNTGIIDEGATVVDFPMYKVELDGSTVTFDQLATVKQVGAAYTAGNGISIVNNEIAIADNANLTGIPTAPTNGTASASTTQLATLEFVQNAINRRVPISKYSNKITNKSIPNNTQTATGATVTIPERSLVIAKGYANFNANATGRRGVFIKNGTSVEAMTYAAAPSAGVSAIECIAFLVCNAGSVWTVDVTQNSGAALTVATAAVDIIAFPI